MKQLLIVFIMLFAAITQEPVQEQKNPELPGLTYPYVDADNNGRSKYKPFCHPEWGPLVGNLYENVQTRMDVIMKFSDEDGTIRSAEWTITEKIEDKYKNTVRCYIFKDDKYVFEKEFPRTN